MYIYIYIVIKEKTNNIFQVKIFRPLPLSIHNISLYKFRFESHKRLNSYEQGTSSFKLQVVQGSTFGNILTTMITLK